ncbi:MAG TPA: sigma-54 dependent transcriptional regulator [Gemmatimonadaceae bacterium]
MRDETNIRLLVADGEPGPRESMERLLAERGFEVTVCGDGRAALDALRADTFDVALLDPALLGVAAPGAGALELLRGVREEEAPIEVIVIAGAGVHVGSGGEYDYVTRPYSTAQVEALVRRAWRRRQLVLENLLLRARLSRLERECEMLTQYAPMRAVMALVDRVARSDSAVFVEGESGTGKSMLARRIHSASHRAAGPFVEVDCSAIAVDSLESDLFGREHATASGSTSRQLGLFELATGGTIFIDEIDALAPGLQGKLLHALELGTFYRTSGTQKAYADPRIIAASSSDLARLVSDGAFRGDLYYRIDTISVTLPALRDRATDIPLLARHFLQSCGGGTVDFSADAMAVLESYQWPGNVSELRGVVERAAALAVDGVIRADHLPFGAVTPSVAPRAAHVGERFAPLEHVEREHIEMVLQHVSWHQGRAAEMLGISPKTLYRKIRQFGFRRPTDSRQQHTL